MNGQIRSVDGEAISNANVVCKSSSNKVITYTFSDLLGKYELRIKTEGDYILEFSSLGFQKQSLALQLQSDSGEIIAKDIVMSKSFMELDEVILAKDRPIVIKKDTIIFDTDSFSRGNEQVVEDLLKNLPNVIIDSEGTISVGNTEVEKVMIEGDDFFKRGYKMITKNMPSQSIDKVEVIENYSENKLLKGINYSDKIALNLKLREQAKRVWFGNVEVVHGLTTTDRYEMSGILMNFGKKNKYYFFSDFNDVGRDAKGNINHLIAPINFDDVAAIGNGERANNLLQLSALPLNFKKNRTNFNNSELFSLNAIFSPSKTLKITANGFFNWDENEFFRNSISIVNVPGAIFTNVEDHRLQKNNKIGFGKVDLVMNLSETESLKSNLSLSKNNDISRSNMLFNSNATIEDLNSSNFLFDKQITYSNRFKKNSVLILTARYTYETTPQSYSINRLYYPELFPLFTTANNVAQNSNNEMYFAGFEAHLLNRQKKGHLSEFQLGNKYRKDNLTSNLLLKENITTLDLAEAYQNNLEYTTNDLYFKTKYSWKTKGLRLTGWLNIHQLINKMKVNSVTENESPFFINPKIGFDWSLNDKNSFRAVYSFTTTNAGVLDVYDNFALTGSRSFTKGTGNFIQLDASNIFFSYQLGNLSDKFFVNSVLVHLRNHDFLSSNTILSQNFDLAQRLIIKDRDLLNFSTNIDYYIRSISSNVKLDLSFSKSNFKNIVNNSEFREISSELYNYGLQIRSGFKGKLNFHTGTKWTKNSITTIATNTFTDNVSYLDLTYITGDKLNFELETERYFFGNLDKPNNTYYFLDFNVHCKLLPNKLQLGVSGNNMFNTRTYRTFSLSDVGNYVTEFRLLPRFILLKVKYRF